jgi:hypothetical protein
MMNQKVEVDLTDMEKKLKCYVDKGSIAGSAEVRKEPMISVKADASLIKPLKKITTYTGSFVAVDCSTRTLKRANNWGVYLMRASCATVRKRQVDWSYSERVCTVVGARAKKDRAYLTENTPYMEYSETELKMLDVGEALLISEPKIKFAVPIKVTHYPEYLETRSKADYALPASPPLSEMDARLKQLSGQKPSLK